MVDRGTAGDDAGDVRAVPAFVGQGRHRRLRIGRLEAGRRRWILGVDQVAEVSMQLPGQALGLVGSAPGRADLEAREVWMAGVDPAVDDRPHDPVTQRSVRVPGGIGLDGGRGPVDLGVQRVVRPDPEDDRWPVEILGAPAVVLHHVAQVRAGEHALVELGCDQRQAAVRTSGSVVLLGYCGGCQPPAWSANPRPQIVERVPDGAEPSGVENVELDDHRHAFVRVVVLTKRLVRLFRHVQIADDR